MTPHEAIQTARAALDALEAALSPSKGAAPSTAPKAQRRPSAPSGPTSTLRVQVDTWHVGISKAGTTYARLITTEGEPYPVFDEDLIKAMDPLFAGDILELELQAFKSRDGNPVSKVVGYRLVERGKSSPRDQRDSASDIPF